MNTPNILALADRVVPVCSLRVGGLKGDPDGEASNITTLTGRRALHSEPRAGPAASTLGGVV